MRLTLEEQLILKTSKYEDEKNTALLLETKDISLEILEKVLLIATFQNSSYLINKILKSHTLPTETLVSALWLSINESKEDAFSDLEAFSTKTINKEKLQTLISEFEAKDDNVQHVVNIIKFQE